MTDQLLQALIAVLAAINFFMLIVIVGMGRTILKIRREGRFNAKDRRHLIDSVKYTTRSLCAREAAHLIRNYFSDLESKIPDLYVKKEDDEYEKYELNIVRDQMKQIRIMLEREMAWEMPDTEEDEYSVVEILKQASQAQTPQPQQT